MCRSTSARIGIAARNDRERRSQARIGHASVVGSHHIDVMLRARMPLAQSITECPARTCKKAGPPRPDDAEGQRN